MRGTADRTADDGGEEKRKGKIELSGAQVAGGASATMVAAFLASSMGVYGTIIGAGAGVVSVGATAGALSPPTPAAGSRSRTPGRGPAGPVPR